MPTRRAFLLEEQHGPTAHEALRLARACGQTPWQVFHDPHRAFNATVMRASDRYRRARLDMALSMMESGDKFGIGRMLVLLRSIVEEL